MRHIKAPGIQVTELDRSGYADLTDNSLVNTASFILGFADKGMDYGKMYVNSMATFEKSFGAPTNEAERYLYNAVYQTINRGGNAYVGKLPYDNDTIDKFSYATYTLLSGLNTLSSPWEVVTRNIGVTQDIEFSEFCLYPDIKVSEHQSFMSIFNECSVSLYVIGDAFSYVKDSMNFPFSSREAEFNIFVKEDGITYRNDSLYMLSAMMSSVDMLSNFGISQDKIDENRDGLEQIQNCLCCSQEDYGYDLYQTIENFGKSKTLAYYREYLANLKTETLEKCSSHGEFEFLSGILDGYDNELMSTKYTAIKHTDGTLTSYMEISSNGSDGTGLIDIEDLDKLRTGVLRVNNMTLKIVDITRNKYGCEHNIIDRSNPREYLGILPVVTTAANAMYVQQMISQEDADFRQFCAISVLNNIKSDNRIYDAESKKYVSISCHLENLNNDNHNTIGFTSNIGGEAQATQYQQTLSKTAVQQFPKLNFRDGIFDRENLKDIGIVVFEMYVDTAADNMIGFTPVEAYCGSLNKRSQDLMTKKNKFIDYIVNSKSSRINVFSNISFSENENVQVKNTDKAQTFLISNQSASSLGFFTKDTQKTISIQKSIFGGIDRILANSKDPNTMRIDMLVDAGISNIGQYLRNVYGKTGKGYYDQSVNNFVNYRITDTGSISIWSQVIQRYDDFCKNVRKDCMFIADGPRQLVLNGNEKRVRNTKIDNTMQNTILKDIKYISGIVNSSYGAGYMNWFYAEDKYSGDYYWCPPSIYANGAYLYTDVNYNYWDAPAGLKRGVLPTGVIDISFNPNNEEAGKIYECQWNYAVSYPTNGIVIEGQKTFQKNKTALDRVNVRRTMLGLEKNVSYVAKFFNYEGITDYMLSRFSDAVTNILQGVKDRNGILDYYVVCDSRNNTVQTVENNEVHCLIAVKPVKSAEFICLTFIATAQGASVQEVVESEL